MSVLSLTRGLTDFTRWLGQFLIGLGLGPMFTGFLSDVLGSYFAEITAELIDRFGALPPQAIRMLKIAELRLDDKFGVAPEPR